MLLRFQDWAKIFQDPHYWAGTSVYPPPSFVMAHYMLSSHRKFSFSHRECMNLQKGSLWNKTSFFKDIFLCKKILTNRKSCKQQPRKVYSCTFSRTISVFLLDSQNFVTRKLFRKQGIYIHVALWKFIKIWCLNQSEVHYNSNVSTFLHFDVLIAFGS